MRIAVVTPYYKEADDILRQCHRSVLDQTVPCDHILIADGFPNEIVKGFRATQHVLACAHADAGNMARVVGSLSAFAHGYDAVAFLDADNWYRPDHIQRLADLHLRTGAAVCTSRRAIHRPDGSFMFEDDKSDGDTHVDTNCFFLTRETMPVIARWTSMPKPFLAAGDTIYWSSLRRSGLPRAHSPAPTVCYRTTYEADFKRLGEPVPEGYKPLAATDAPFRWLASLPVRDRWRIWKDFGFPFMPRSVAKLRVMYALSMPFSLTRPRLAK